MGIHTHLNGIMLVSPVLGLHIHEQAEPVLMKHLLDVVVIPEGLGCFVNFSSNLLGIHFFKFLSQTGFDPFQQRNRPLSFKNGFWSLRFDRVLLIPFVFFKVDINRAWGCILTTLYVIYILVILT